MRADFVFSDPHFDHENCIKYDGRPFLNKKEMGDRILEEYNSRVSKKNVVIITGDVAWKYHYEYIKAMNGIKILVLGNHDDMSRESLNLFREVHELLRVKIGKQDVTFSHCPQLSWASSIHGSWNIHGHCHGRLEEKEPIARLDISCNIHNYAPLPWEYVCFLMKKRLEVTKTKKQISKDILKLFKLLMFGNNKVVDKHPGTENMEFMKKRNASYWQEYLSLNK